MTKLVERLREGVWYPEDTLAVEKTMDEAADEIERLQARVSQLVSQLDEQYGTPCEQIRHQQESERLRAALQEIAGNRTNSRAWLEDKARRALEPKP